MFFDNPEYAEYIRCGYKDEDLDFSATYTKLFAERYANYVLNFKKL